MNMCLMIRVLICIFFSHLDFDLEMISIVPAQILAEDTLWKFHLYWMLENTICKLLFYWKFPIITYQNHFHNQAVYNI